MLKILILSSSSHSLIDSCIERLVARSNYTLLHINIFNIEELEEKEKIKKEILLFNPDVYFWWWCGIELDILREVKSLSTKKTMWILWNDDPACWYEKERKNLKKASFFDLIIVSCTKDKEYEKYCKEVVLYHPFYDKNLNHPLETEYEYDVSFCINNIYDEEIYEGVFPRKTLIDKLCKASAEGSFEFALFGPEYLQYLYPRNYKKYCEYSSLNSIYNKSKINISTHIISDPEYFNERSLAILASGGTLLSEKELKAFPNSSYLLMEEDVVAQIVRVLNSENRNVKSDNSSKVELDEYELKNFIELIHCKIFLFFLQEEFYRTTYSIPENIIDVKEYWSKYGKDNHIPFPLDVPTEFDYEAFKKDHNLELEKTSIYALYLSSRDKEEKYLQPLPLLSTHQTLLDESGVDLEEWLRVENIFNNLQSNTCIERSWKRLVKIQKKLPDIDIDKLLSYHFQLSS